MSTSLWPRAQCFMPIQSIPAVCESETSVSKEAGAEGCPLPHLARPLGFWQSPSLPPRPPTQLLSQRWISPFRDPGASFCSSGDLTLLASRQHMGLFLDGKHFVASSMVRCQSCLLSQVQTPPLGALRHPSWLSLAQGQAAWQKGAEPGSECGSSRASRGAPGD